MARVPRRTSSLRARTEVTVPAMPAMPQSVTMPVAFRAALVAVTALALVACGGGGSGGGGGNAPAPTAAFTATPTDGVSPLHVDFNGASSSAVNGTITAYAWDFGDGSPGVSTANAAHVYTATSSGANYTAQLTVHDSHGGVATKIATIHVAPPQGLGITLSGTVQILPSSAVDADVNDTNTTPASNDDFGHAQSIPNPVALGGYLTRPGRGNDGNLKASGDLADFYRVSLTGNETILLTVGDPSPSDPLDNPTLSLQLWDAAHTLCDSTIVTDSGSLTATAATPTCTFPGTFFVEVSITSGATNYVLNLGQTVTAAGARTARVSDDFVPGELVLVAPEAALPDGYLVTSGDASLELVDVSAGLPLRRGLARMAGPRVGGVVSSRAADKYETLSAIVALRKAQRHALVEPNYVRHATATPNDPYYHYQWNYASINLPLAWDITTGSSNVIVAVIDTGILPQHPDIQGQLVSGYDFIKSTSASRDGNGIDNDPTDPGDLAFGSSSSFHGTHVSGTIAADSDNNVGVAGVAWHTKVMPLRALGVDGGTSYDIMQCMRFAAGMANDSGTVPAQHADIINMSLGGGSPSQAEQALINSVRAQGIFIVAAAGNDSSSSPSYPAAYSGVISVSATTIAKSLAFYSNFGSTIDVAAPGGDNSTDLNGDGLGDGVLSTEGDDSGSALVYGYAALSGTSMATPHVSGVIALMKAVDPALTPEEFDTALAGGELTDDLGTAGYDQLFGWGLIDAQKAVVAALGLAGGGGPTTPILVGSPNSVNFGPTLTQFDVTVRNAGGGTMSIVGTSTSAPWLVVAPGSVDAHGLGTYHLNANRALLLTMPDGTYSAQATFTSDISGGSPFVVTALVQTFHVNPQANAGLQYIIVFHPATGVTVGGVALQASGGVYNYSIPNLGPGDYQIYAGTDDNNDGFLCDGGEACGAYPLVDQPDTITVDGSTSGIDFVSGFRVNLLGNTIKGTSQSPSAPVSVHVPKPVIGPPP